MVSVMRSPEADQRRALRIAAGLNAAMFVIGTVAGILARSSSLLADALDMLADAAAYAIALIAIGGTAALKRRTALTSGVVLVLQGVAVIADAIRRALTDGGPEGRAILAVAILSLAVNATVLRMLYRFRQGEVHLRAAWIFTRADVIASVAVLAAGALVLATGSRLPDLVVGCAIGVYVLTEAIEILRMARADA